MKVSIIRIDKKNQLHLSHKDLEKMLERMKQDTRQEIEQCGRPAPAHPHLPIQQPEQSAQT